MVRIKLWLVVTILSLVSLLIISCRPTSAPITTPTIEEPEEPVVSDNADLTPSTIVEPHEPVPSDIPEPVSPTSIEPEEPELPTIPTTEFRVIKDIEYGRGGDISLLLDILTH